MCAGPQCHASAAGPTRCFGSTVTRTRWPNMSRIPHGGFLPWPMAPWPRSSPQCIRLGRVQSGYTLKGAGLAQAGRLLHLCSIQGCCSNAATVVVGREDVPGPLCVTGIPVCGQWAQEPQKKRSQAQLVLTAKHGSEALFCAPPEGQHAGAHTTKSLGLCESFCARSGGLVYSLHSGSVQLLSGTGCFNGEIDMIPPSLQLGRS